LVERRSPKPEVGGSIPSAPAKKEIEIKMINPLRFIQEVKQEAFKVSWTSKKDVLIGSAMVFVLTAIAAVFFLLLDQLYKFFLDLLLTINI
jgi:preprotein translocase subunit SecE